MQKNMDKQQARHNAVIKCKNFDSAYIEAAQEYMLLSMLPILEKVKKVVIYNAYSWEFKLARFITYCLSCDIELFQPVASKLDKKMKLRPYVSDVSTTNILIEHEEYLNYSQEDVRWYNVDLILLPLVAVDPVGTRVGKGGGYYDVTLAELKDKNLSPIFCGVGYASQMVDELIEKCLWDVSLDYFVSEAGLVKFYKNSNLNL